MIANVSLLCTEDVDLDIGLARNLWILYRFSIEATPLGNSVEPRAGDDIPLRFNLYVFGR